MTAHVFQQYTPQEMMSRATGELLAQLSGAELAVAALAASEAARFYDVPAAEIYGVRGDGAGRMDWRPASRSARILAIYIACVVFGMPRQRCRKVYGVGRDLVRKAMQRVEELRDDKPDLDEVLQRLETLSALGVRDV